MTMPPTTTTSTKFSDNNNISAFLHTPTHASLNEMNHNHQLYDGVPISHSNNHGIPISHSNHGIPISHSNHGIPISQLDGRLEACRKRLKNEQQKAEKKEKNENSASDESFLKKINSKYKKRKLNQNGDNEDTEKTTSSTKKIRESKKVPFASKLRKMLETQSKPGTFGWREDGLAFYVKNESVFVSILKHSDFRTESMSSFHRQLNNYGFKGEKHIFQHPKFQRNNPQLDTEIVRKPPPKDDASTAHLKSQLQYLRTKYNKLHQLMETNILPILQILSSQFPHIEIPQLTDMKTFFSQSSSTTSTETTPDDDVHNNNNNEDATFILPSLPSLPPLSEYTNKTPKFADYFPISNMGHPPVSNMGHPPVSNMGHPPITLQSYTAPSHSSQTHPIQIPSTILENENKGDNNNVQKKNSTNEGKPTTIYQRPAVNVFPKITNNTTTTINSFDSLYIKTPSSYSSSLLFDNQSDSLYLSSLTTPTTSSFKSFSALPTHNSSVLFSQDPTSSVLSLKSVLSTPTSSVLSSVLSTPKSSF